MKQQASWVLMFILALLLIIIGFEGSLGKSFACFFCPQEVQVLTED